MVKIYDNLRDENGNDVFGRSMLFITKIDEHGNIGECLTGVAGAPLTSGTMFIVDDWLIDQLDKVQFIDGQLSVKDGMELDEPVKSEKELQREALLKQLAELDSQPLE